MDGLINFPEAMPPRTRAPHRNAVRWLVCFSRLKIEYLGPTLAMSGRRKKNIQTKERLPWPFCRSDYAAFGSPSINEGEASASSIMVTFLVQGVLSCSEGC